MASADSAMNLTSEFLWSSASKLSSCSKSNILPVISQLRQKCVSLVREGVSSSAPFQLSEVCNTCGNIWSEGSFKIKVLPHSKRMKKLKKKYESNSTALSSKFKKNYSLFLERRKDNTMVRECKICSNKKKIGLRKPQIIKTPILESIETFDNTVSNKKKRKRKSKKDSFSGLNVSAVVNARLSLMSRDSVGSNTSLNCWNKDSILNNTSTKSDTTMDSSINDSISLDAERPKSKLKEKLSIGTSSSTKKQKYEHVQSQKSKCKKKNKKSIVSDFLNFL